MAFMVFNPTGEYDYHVFAYRESAQDHANSVTQDSPDPNFEAKVIPLFSVSKEQIESLRKYVVANGADHDDGCPQDDTCSCSEKRHHEHLNELCDIKFD